MRAGFRRVSWLGRVVLILTIVVMLDGCAKLSRFHAQYVPEASLRLGEVMVTATRREILDNPLLHETLINAGVAESDIADGSVVTTRIFCCGGPNEMDTALWVYVPRSVDVETGDIVEIWSARSLSQGEQFAGLPNTVVRVRQSRDATDRRCRWTPEREGLWARTLYCDGLESEGWYQQEGVFNVWVKADATNPLE